MNRLSRSALQRASVHPAPGWVMSAALVFCLASSVASLASAQSATRVYRCDGPNGTPLYQNSPGKGCELLDLPPINSVPAAKLPEVLRNGSTSGASSGARVSQSQQRGRDSDRRRILETELAREQSRLEEARKAYNDGAPERHADERNYQKYLDRVESLKQQVTQAEQNVSSLQRELDSLR
ncbi:MAG: DUF4124 domain-containing protein [Lautropia sp.]|nr:DUF4124 domain-containing protein [Lautropia sp.]